MLRFLARAVLASLAVLGLGSASSAQDLWRDYQAAMSTFRGGQSEPAEYYEAVLAEIMDGIEGRWAPVSGLGLKPGDDETLRRACGLVYSEAKKISDFSFSFTRHSGGGASSVAYRYTLAIANIFGFSADDGEVLRFFGMDKPGTSFTTKQSVLRWANGLAELYRPGPDVLVVKNMLGIPDIYVRCN
jgi:hypothetical protein